MAGQRESQIAAFDYLVSNDVIPLKVQRLVKAGMAQAEAIARVRSDFTSVYSARNYSLQVAARNLALSKNLPTIDFRKSERIKTETPSTRQISKRKSSNVPQSPPSRESPRFTVKRADRKTVPYRFDKRPRRVTYTSYTVDLPEGTQVETALLALQSIADAYKSGQQFAQCFMVGSRYKTVQGWVYITRSATRETAQGCVSSFTRNTFQTFFGSGDVSIIRVGIRFRTSPTEI